MNLDKFPRGTEIPSADQVRRLVQATVREMTGTNDVVTASDDQNTIVKKSDDQQFLRLPNRITAPGLDLGFSVDLVNLGEHAMVLVPENGETIVSANDLMSIAQGTAMTARVVDVDSSGNRSWLVAGALTDYNDTTPWTQRTPIVPETDNRGVAWSPSLGLFAAVSGGGVQGRIQTSPDGVTWTERTSPDVNTKWTDIVWSEETGLFVAVGFVAGFGAGVRIMTSPDAITWTARNSDAVVLNAVAYSPELGRFVAAGWSTSLSLVYTSSDGITWVSHDITAVVPWLDYAPSQIEWSPELGLFVMGSDAGTSVMLVTSKDGITWTVTLRYPAGGNGIGSVNWSPQLGKFIALTDYGLDPSTIPPVYTSSDGYNWTGFVVPGLFYPYGSTWVDGYGLFIAKNYNDDVMWISTDGENWESVSTGTNSFIAGPGNFAWSPELGIVVVVGYSLNTLRIATSNPL